MLKPSVSETPICHCVEFVVQPGQPVALELMGDAVEALLDPVHLGQVLPPMRLVLKDSAGVRPTSCCAVETPCRYR